MRSLRPCSDSSATPSFPSQPEGKIGLPRANPRGWRIPGMEEPGWLPSTGSHSRARLKRLSSSSSRSQSCGFIHENSVLSPLEKWPQLSLVRQHEAYCAQPWMVRNLFPKSTELWRILLLSKASHCNRRGRRGDHVPFSKTHRGRPFPLRK